MSDVSNDCCDLVHGGITLASLLSSHYSKAGKGLGLGLRLGLGLGMSERGSFESPINDSLLWVDADIAQRQSTILMLDHRVLPIGDRQTMSLTIRKLDR